MKLLLASISKRKGRAKSDPADALFRDFLERSARYTPAEAQVFESEAHLLAASERTQAGGASQSAATLILFDSRGDLLTSEQFAELLGRLRDGGTQRVLLGIGPADGWSKAALARADRTLSFGRITLPHELARTILAEQTYRALTILAGHPYHCGH
jgi:23S rRNA (pseudouridine1915-N3)-methyltransferase